MPSRPPCDRGHGVRNGHTLIDAYISSNGERAGSRLGRRDGPYAEYMCEGVRCHVLADIPQIQLVPNSGIMDLIFYQTWVRVSVFIFLPDGL